MSTVARQGPDASASKVSDEEVPDSGTRRGELRSQQRDRCGGRRYTTWLGRGPRLTDAYSRPLEKHAAGISLHFMFYDFAGPHDPL